MLDTRWTSGQRGWSGVPGTLVLGRERTEVRESRLSRGPYPTHEPRVTDRSNGAGQ